MTNDEIILDPAIAERLEKIEERTKTLVSIDGPFTERPSGKFTARTGEPILKRCDPHWIVRYLHGTVLKGEEFASEKAAQDFGAGLAALT